jgi:replicative DNA helicase
MSLIPKDFLSKIIKSKKVIIEDNLTKYPDDIMETAALYDFIRSGEIVKTEYQSKRNQNIFNHLANIFQKRGRITIEQFEDYLTSNGLMNECGGGGYVMAILRLRAPDLYNRGDL